MAIDLYQEWISPFLPWWLVVQYWCLEVPRMENPYWRAHVVGTHVKQIKAGCLLSELMIGNHTSASRWWILMLKVKFADIYDKVYQNTKKCNTHKTMYKWTHLEKSKLKVRGVLFISAYNGNLLKRTSGVGWIIHHSSCHLFNFVQEDLFVVFKI